MPKYKEIKGVNVDKPRLFVTVQRAAEISGESPWTWRARAYRGDIESAKPAGPKSRLLLPLDDVERFLAAGLRPRLNG